MKPVYIAAYHQSVFGKLMGMTVPEIVEKARPRHLPRDRDDPSGRSTSPRSAPRATSR